MKKNVLMGLIALVIVVLISACGNDSKKKMENSAALKINANDSAKIADDAVENYILINIEKNRVADSARTADGFKEIDFSPLGMFSIERISPPAKNVIISSSDLNWRVTYTFGLGYNSMALLISEIRTNPDVIIAVLEKNKVAIKKVLELTGNMDAARDLYAREIAWFEGANPIKSKQFAEFYKKHGHLTYFPYNSKDTTNLVEVAFWNDMNIIIQSDLEYFGEGEHESAPESYKDWLFCQRWRNRLGDETLKKYAAAIKNILY